MQHNGTLMIGHQQVPRHAATVVCTNLMHSDLGACEGKRAASSEAGDWRWSCAKMMPGAQRHVTRCWETSLDHAGLKKRCSYPSGGRGDGVGTAGEADRSPLVLHRRRRACGGCRCLGWSALGAGGGS